jgi:putative addiction module killer protein
VTTARGRLELGNTSAIKWFGAFGEYRIDWGPGYRMYLAQDGEQLIVLFGGGTKQRQQADIEQARALYDEYKARKKMVKEQPRRRR